MAGLALWFAAPVAAQDALCETDNACRSAYEDALLALTGPQDLAAADLIAEHACREVEAGWACGVLANIVVSGPDPTEEDWQQFDDLKAMACLWGGTRECQPLELGTVIDTGEMPLPLPFQARERECLAGNGPICQQLSLTLHPSRFARYEALCADGSEPLACMMVSLGALQSALLAEDFAAMSDVMVDVIGHCLDGQLPACHIATFWRDTSSVSDEFEAVFAQTQDLMAFACVEGDAQACSALGMRMYTATHDVSRDHPGVISLFQRACDGGDLGACTFLANTPGQASEALRREVLAQSCLYTRHPNLCEELRDMGDVPGSEDQTRTAAALDALIEAFAFD